MGVVDRKIDADELYIERCLRIVAISRGIYIYHARLCFTSIGVITTAMEVIIVTYKPKDQVTSPRSPYLHIFLASLGVHNA
jgi:hypothetical protein